MTFSIHDWNKYTKKKTRMKIFEIYKFLLFSFFNTQKEAVTLGEILSNNYRAAVSGRNEE